MKQKEKKPAPEMMFTGFLGSQVDSGGALFATSGRVLYEWTGIYWRPLDDLESDRMAYDWLCVNAFSSATQKKASSCVATAAVGLPPLPEPPHMHDRVVIPVRNGYLEISDTGQLLDGYGRIWQRRLLQPDRKLGITYALNCDYKPGATCPVFDKFIEEILPDPAVRAYLQEYIGYTLLPDTRFQIASFFFGGGRNGKSKLIEIVSALHRRVVSMSLDELKGFTLQNILGASLVSVDETTKNIDEQKLKSLISGGLMQIERKYRDPVNVKPTAKWIIAGNQLPAIKDHSLGFWRRMIIIPFTTTIPEERSDPLIAEKIISTELSGVLNWALGGLQRLMERGKMPPTPKIIQEQIESAKRETNSVYAWVYDAEVKKSDQVTSKSEVYSDYRLWSQKHGHSPVSVEGFWRRMQMLFDGLDINARTRVDGKQIRVVPLSIGNYTLDSGVRQ